MTDNEVARSRNKAKKKSSSLYRLDPFLDENGILCVGCRIRRASLPNEATHPVILLKKGHVTDLVICHHHQRTKHQSRGITHNRIRSNGFWIISGGSTVANHMSKCVKCRTYEETQQQKMADLPGDRLEPAPPFTYSAVDYFGPLNVKERRRELNRYAVFFTCLASYQR